MLEKLERHDGHSAFVWELTRDVGISEDEVALLIRKAAEAEHVLVGPEEASLPTGAIYAKLTPLGYRHVQDQHRRTARESTLRESGATFHAEGDMNIASMVFGGTVDNSGATISGRADVKLFGEFMSSVRELRGSLDSSSAAAAYVDEEINSLAERGADAQGAVGRLAAFAVKCGAVGAPVIKAAKALHDATGWSTS